MKINSILLFLVLSGFHLSAQRYIHVGYINGDPIVVEVKSNVAFSINGKLQLVKYKSFPDSLKLEYISNCGEIKVSKKKNKLYHPLFQFESKHGIDSPTTDDNCKHSAYAIDGTITVYEGKKRLGQLKGENPFIMNGYLYYYSYDRNSDAFTDIYRSDLSALENKELILKGVYDVGILFFDNRYIAYQETSKTGGTDFLIYDISTKTNFKIEKLPARYDEPMFFPKDKVLRFREPATVRFSKPIKYRKI
jgi:hypothetical protein